MDNRTLEIMEAACCIWEHYINETLRESWALKNPDVDGPYTKHRAAFGTSAVRWACLELADRCHEDWEEAAVKRGYNESFDFDFVPEWFEACVEFCGAGILAYREEEREAFLTRVTGKRKAEKLVLVGHDGRFWTGETDSSADVWSPCPEDAADIRTVRLPDGTVVPPGFTHNLPTYASVEDTK